MPSQDRDREIIYVTGEGAEMGVLGTHAKECQQSLETRRDQEQILPKSTGGGAQPR